MMVLGSTSARNAGFRVLPLLIACCGQSNDHDGGDPSPGAADAADVGGDASGNDASTFGTATITLEPGRVHPLDTNEGVPVLFLGPDGALAVETVTDGDGRAIATIASGSAAIIALPDTEHTNAKTTYAVLGLEPGDDVVLRLFRDRPTLGAMTLELPAYPGANGYEVTTGCGVTTSATSTVTISLLAGCTPEGQFRYLARAKSNIDVLGFASGSATFLADGTVTHEGAWAPSGMLTVHFSNPLEGHVDVGGTIDAVDGDRNFERIGAAAAAAGAAVDVAFPVAPGFAHVTSIGMNPDPSNPGRGEQWLAVHTPADATEATVDLEAERLPYLYRPQFDATSRSIVVERATNGAAADAMTGIIFFHEGTQSHAWMLLAPPDATAIEFPLLPEPYADRVPVEPVVDLLLVYLEAASDWDGYRDARQRGFEADSFESAQRHPAPSRVVTSRNYIDP